MQVRRTVLGGLRRAVDRLPEDVRDGVTRKRAELKGLGQLKVNQDVLAMRLVELERRQLGAPVAPSDVPDDRFPPGVRSRLCTQAQLDEPWFEEWCSQFAEPPLKHRKSWEFAYVAHVLDTLGCLEPGRRGVGFGVGREPIVAALAARGVEVLATDIDPDSKEARVWSMTGQHAHGAEGMLRPEVCDPDVFRQLVRWQAVDMRDIPPDIKGFDFCWSTCALEHLGTLQAGVDFIEASLATLAPGGLAIHTTEFNLSSNDRTIEQGPVVVYRERDIVALCDRLEAAGHEVAALDLSPGDGLLDHYVDLPPYTDEPCLRFLFGSYIMTSIALVIRARA